MNLFDEVSKDIREAQLDNIVYKELGSEEAKELLDSADFYVVPGPPDIIFVLDRNAVSKERAQRFCRVAFEVTGIDRILLVRFLGGNMTKLRWVSE